MRILLFDWFLSLVVSPAKRIYRCTGGLYVLVQCMGMNARRAAVASDLVENFNDSAFSQSLRRHVVE